tara:strand:+ start:17 stop:442 length:426 start_codon:yes stop_codon:yes gene_type:complete
MDPDKKKKMEKALAKGRYVLEKRGRNPAMANKSLKQNVESELGQTGGPTKEDREKARDSLAVFLNRSGLQGLPRLSERGGHKMKYNEVGGPKEDLEEVSAQLGKASKLHGNQSKRVADIAKGMKGESGNPYMKRGKSKYGM